MGEGFRVAYSCQAGSCDGHHLTPAFQRIFDSISQVRDGHGTGTRNKEHQSEARIFHGVS